eukprot:UN32303
MYEHAPSRLRMYVTVYVVPENEKAPTNVKVITGKDQKPNLLWKTRRGKTYLSSLSNSHQSSSNQINKSEICNIDSQYLYRFRVVKHNSFNANTVRFLDVHIKKGQLIMTHPTRVG